MVRDLPRSVAARDQVLLGTRPTRYDARYPGPRGRAGHRASRCVQVVRGGVARAAAPTGRSAQACGEVLVERCEELLGREPGLVAPDERGEVLGHLAALDGLD